MDILLGIEKYRMGSIQNSFIAKVIAVCLMCLLCQEEIFSQANNSPFKQKSSGKVWIKDKIKKARIQANGFSLNLGTNMSFFINPTYGNSFKNGDVEYLFKLQYLLSQFGFRAVLLPVIIEQHYFASIPHTTYGQSELNNVRHKGMTFSLSLSMLPFSKYVYPYMGLGYSFSSIGDDTRLLYISDDQANTSAPFWKFGIALHASKKFSLTAEYLSSINSIESIGLDINSGRQFGMFQFTMAAYVSKFKFK